MKTCSYCGHQNPEDAVRCSDCGWAVPKRHTYSKLGTVLKRAAGATMITFAMFQFVSCIAIKVKGGGGEDGIYGAVFAFYSWRAFFIAIVLGSALFWIGDHLKRTH